MDLKMFACADLGNTFLKVCVFKGRSVVSTMRTAYRENSKSAFRRAAEWLRKRSARAVALSSVNYSAEAALSSALREQGIAVIRLRKKLSAGIRSAYDLRRIGTDRLANIIAARGDYPDKNLMVLCSGTALTLDVIEGTLHTGGFIAPGEATLFSSLHEKADLLPRVRAGVCPEKPGRSTREAISGGCALLWTGGVRAMADFIAASSQKKFRLILTGGGADRLAAIFPYAKKDDTLTFRGIRRMAEGR
jgi:pantothenate kinase type III